MTKHLSLAAIILASSIFSSSAFGRNVWRECGIGGMLFSTSDYGWAAITSNIVWDLGTTATSSAVSSEDLCEGAKASAAQFIHENYANLEEETARGEGLHLNAMLSVLNCNSGSHQSIINQVRAGLLNSATQPEFSSQADSDKAEAYFNILINAVESRHSSECRLS